MAKVTDEFEGGRDPKIEKYLNDIGVKYDLLTNVAPGAFDAKRSLENQARMGAPIVPETADRYELDLRNGDRFPPVIAVRLPSGQLEVLDGNHRREAHERLGLGMNVYLIDPSTPKTLQQQITFEGNIHHGMPSTVADRRHHAMHMVNNGKSVAEAARRFGVPQHQLQKDVTLLIATRRAEDSEVPIRKWESLPLGIQLKLNTIHTDEGFKQAVELAADAKLSSTAVNDLVKAVNVSKAASKQAAIVATWREDQAPAIQASVTGTGTSAHRSGATSSPKGRIALGLGQVRAALNSSEIDSMAPNQVDDLRTVLTEGIRELQDMLTKLSGPNEPAEGQLV